MLKEGLNLNAIEHSHAALEKLIKRNKPTSF
ncbi:MAG: hypothetical protein HY094_04300 [Candidatus Melainabacteria bacterium]|nr:hypothetical protein [Candidatus Melainabacteria bacterium]